MEVSTMEIRGLGSPNSSQLKQIKKDPVKDVRSSSENDFSKEYGKITGDSIKYIELSRKIPNVRNHLVQSYKNSINEGTYSINISEIVKKMLGDI
jgi:negative regulator of flagellin synthesis FlgM